jgi:hypothetical protein
MHASSAKSSVHVGAATAAYARVIIIDALRALGRRYRTLQ